MRNLASLLIACVLSVAMLAASSLSPVYAQGDLVVLKRVAPEYPRRAAMAGIEGSVTMQFTINADGSVSDVRVTEANPRRVFDRAAVAALSEWAFEPFREGGEAISREASITIDFRL
jgi:protein TonB